MQTPKEMGALIAELRRKKNLTQRALADRLQVTDKAVSRWERGVGYPDYSLLDRLCEVLEVSAEQLLFGAGRHSPEKGADLSVDDAGAGASAAASPKPPEEQDRPLSEVWADAEKAYRARLRKRRRIAAAVLVLLLCAALLYRAYFQPRVRRTLTGSWTTLQGEAVPVRVELDGRLHSFLFRRDLYYGGTLEIEAADGSVLLFSRTFVARNHAEGLDVIGLLSDLEDAYHCSAMLYCWEQNRFGNLSIWFSKDFTKL